MVEHYRDFKLFLSPEKFEISHSMAISDINTHSNVTWFTSALIASGQWESVSFSIFVAVNRMSERLQEACFKFHCRSILK
jgi:hypothetical protein